MNNVDEFLSADEFHATLNEFIDDMHNTLRVDFAHILWRMEDADGNPLPSKACYFGFTDDVLAALVRAQHSLLTQEIDDEEAE